jgi:Holliday junction DNA helicase RuvA
MIGYLQGKIVDCSPTKTYIDINGLGYEVFITLFTYEKIKDAASCKLFTHLQVREDAWTLFGFYNTAEKETFQQLISISGLGAATSRVILSSINYQELAKIIANGDAKALEKVKGIGAKTAQRIILELRGKLLLTGQENINAPAHNTNENDALMALVGLGIGKSNAESAIQKVMEKEGEALPVEVLIKLALKNL